MRTTSESRLAVLIGPVVLALAATSCLVSIGDVESDSNSGGAGGSAGSAGNGGSAGSSGGAAGSSGGGGSGGGSGAAGSGGSGGAKLHECLLPPVVPGGPALPAEDFFDLSFPVTTGTTLNVAAGQDLQAAIDQAQPGDEVVIAAGATFTGRFVLPVKNGDGWVTIRSSALDALPEGQRVAPADAADMPTLRSPDAEPALITSNGAHHYRIAGIRFAASESVVCNNLVTTGLAGVTTVAEQPHHLVFDRCLFQGEPKIGSQRGLKLNAAYAAVLDSYFADFKSSTLDANAISPWNGPGPFLIHNNHLEASYSTLRIGGEDPAIDQLVPSDIRICNNHITRPLSWKEDDPSHDGSNWNNGYLITIASGRRVLISGNVIEHAWNDTTSGLAIVLSPKNGTGTHTWAVAEDVTVAFNVVRKVGLGLWLDSAAGTYPDDGIRRIHVHGNLLYEVGVGAFAGPGRMIQTLGPVDGLIATRNTVFVPSAVVYIGDTGSLVFLDNIAGPSAYGIFGANATEGSATLAKLSSADVRYNVLVERPASLYPMPNYFPETTAEVGFVDAAQHDYRLAASSPYLDKSSTGGPVGADVAALMAAAAVVAP